MVDRTNIGLPDISAVELDVRPLSGWYDEWVFGIKEEQNKISLKFPVLDHEMKGKLRGKLCVVIHYGGTKKSLFAQNVAHYNVTHNNMRVIYSSMEMGVVELSSRFIDIQVAYENLNENVSLYLERLHKSNPDYVKKVFDEYVAPAYSDRLQISQNSGLTCDEYVTMIDNVTGNIGAVDMLVVDGLSMMGGRGSELELANLHTRRLKELAKDKNIFVMCIVHASRGGNKHDRDVSKYARGSEKIIDNCDFYVCPSLVESSGGEYRHDIGYLRLVNKRGSGNTVNMVYSFDPLRLLMEQSSIKPYEIETNNLGNDPGF